MAYDFLVMAAVVKELRETVLGARVQRVYQPGRYELVLHLHRHSERRLLLSCDPRTARIHLTERPARNPEQPAPFCMLLRKYLTGGSIAGIEQQPLERVLELSFDPPGGMPAVKLAAEIMGRRSNLVLVGADGIILGAVRTTPRERNPVRPIVPGERYRAVPVPAKLNPLEAGRDELTDALAAQLAQGALPERALVDTVHGIGPLAARELLHRAGWEAENFERSAGRLYEALRELLHNGLSGEPAPVLARRYNCYAAFSLTHLPEVEQERFTGVSRMLDLYYRALDLKENTRRLRETLQNRTAGRLERLARKREALQSELKQAGEGGRYRLYGEALLAYGFHVPRGAVEAKLPDPYHPEKTIAIPLDPSLTPGANAQKFFSRYRKAVQGRKKIAEQLARTEAEIRYGDAVAFAVENGDLHSLEEIRQELMEAGWLRAQKKASPAKETSPPQPLVFRASSGHPILVGLNNRQNDYLTFKVAGRRDTWLHVHDLPGGHVVIRDVPFPPPGEDLEEAALLAAHFSRGRYNAAVSVDYTAARHVRRGPGGRLGFALYDNFDTITVNPRDERLQRLLAQHPDKI